MRHLFVYGTLLAGEHNHALLQGARCLGPATTEPRFHLVDLGEQPALVRGGRTAVRGELYAVDRPTLARLDQLEDHPRCYCRTPIRLADGREVDAYLLPASRARGRPRLAEGDWRVRRATRPGDPARSLGFRLLGSAAALDAALDRIHVACDVAGIEERAGSVDVWLAAGSRPLPLLAAVAVSTLTDDGRAWTGHEHDVPLRIASDLVVRPPWVAPLEGFAGTELVVPRGMAFGSGEHASTRLALCLLHELLPGRGSFADIGTGSGILALYASRKGCAPIVACDLERDAVLAARALLPGARVVQGGPEALCARVDHLAANLGGGELLACWPALLRLWPGRGVLVLSGMRPAEQAALEALLPRPPARTLREGGFGAIALAG